MLRAAAPAPIATIQSSGEFRLDGKILNDQLARTEGGVRDGSVVETLLTPSEIRWRSGGSVTLQPATSVEVHGGRIVVQRGAGVLRDAAAEAGGLRIVPASSSDLVEVSVTSTGRVAVAAESGSAEVRAASGTLIARVLPEMPLLFAPQQNGTEPSKVTGCVVTKGSSYVLTDTTTNVAVELQGANLSTYVGRLIEATGPMNPNSAVVKEADQILRANTVRDLGPCPRSARTPPAGRGGGAGGAGAAAGHGAVVLGSVVGGVAVAGTFIGLGAAGTFSGSSSVSPSK